MLHKAIGPWRKDYRQGKEALASDFRHLDSWRGLAPTFACGTPASGRNPRFKLTHYVCHEHTNRKGGMELQER